MRTQTPTADVSAAWHSRDVFCENPQKVREYIRARKREAQREETRAFWGESHGSKPALMQKGFIRFIKGSLDAACGHL